MKRKALVHRGTPGELTEPQLMYLICGHNFTGEVAFDSDAEARAAWREHRDELMARRDGEMSFTRYQSGERPHGWWAFEAKKPRLQIAGPPVKQIGKELWEGMPRLMEELPKGCEYESQATYLERLGLLLPGERELIKADGWKPSIG